MTTWRAPCWRPAWLDPGRIWSRHGFACSAAQAAARGRAAAAAWHDRLPPATPAPPAWVLVGGTGLLGSRMAALLLGEPGDAPVVVVARRPEAIGDAWAAFLSPAQARGLLRDPRLRLVAADLAGGGLEWTAQVPRAAVVVHLAARVHALAGWRLLAPLNLGGLRGSLALARRDGALLQLASSLSVFVSSGATRRGVAGPVPPSPGRWLFGGYAQAKLAAEAALEAAAPDRWQVVRYGLLVPGPGEPFPAGHFAPAFARALAAAGGVPDEAEEAAVDLTACEAAAARAVALACTGTPGWAHVAGPVPARLSAVVAALEERRGRWPVQAHAAWAASVDRLPAMGRALMRAAFAKSLFLRTDAAHGPVLNVDLFQATHRRYVAPQGVDALPGPAALLPGVAASMLAG